MADKSEARVGQWPSSNQCETTGEETKQLDLNLEKGVTFPQSPQESLRDDSHWKPGYLNRLPVLGLGSLIVVLLCAIGSVLTLSIADGKSQSQWPQQIAPNVIVNILNSVTNICFGVAISHGIAIAWWRKILQGGTVRQLNRNWQFSSSFRHVVLGARYFNLIALAALTAKLTIIDGALLQKSFSQKVSPNLAAAINITGYANTTIPNTGRVSGLDSQPGLLAENFNDDLKIWSQGGGLLPNSYQDRDGLCYLGVPGAGFEFDCGETQTAAINSGNTTVSAFLALQSNVACHSENSTTIATCTALQEGLSAPLFYVGFEATYSDGTTMNNGKNYSYITMNMIYTVAEDSSEEGTDSCPGTKYIQTCILRPAVIDYPVEIQSFDDSHTLHSMTLAVDGLKTDNSTFRDFNTTLKQQNHFPIIHYNDVHESHATTSNDSRTRLGGVTQGLNTYLGGNASMYYDPITGFQLDQSGNAPVYLTNDLGTQEGRAQSKNLCGFRYNDPMTPQTFQNNAAADPAHHYDVPSIIGKINQIMFATALDISNEDNDKDTVAGTLSRPATVYRDTIHYVIDKGYMWGAFASIMACIVCVLPVYWGYWQLGRKVTLGPLEIAAAFRAPNLNHDSNAPIKEVIGEIGERRVKFGWIVRGDGAGRIGVAEPENVVGIGHAAVDGGMRK
ncbi:hypothetical protein DOTSEDRAFT_55859 [Dothistroma septosporum NZE10]|uniref:Uncharacterized protein n=1 Tax=Dothistroma septosporum (strain NZE10 / CBS 128990) TaxID=675120 RepID=N1PHG7_DOTSN|nr:hypothetical protein DOTSEDRAFT_55859 [Dothistroma septosporum NZE10]